MAVVTALAVGAAVLLAAFVAYAGVRSELRAPVDEQRCPHCAASQIAFKCCGVVARSVGKRLN